MNRVNTPWLWCTRSRTCERKVWRKADLPAHRCRFRTVHPPDPWAGPVDPSVALSTDQQQLEFQWRGVGCVISRHPSNRNRHPAGFSFYFCKCWKFSWRKADDRPEVVSIHPPKCRGDPSGSADVPPSRKSARISSGSRRAGTQAVVPLWPIAARRNGWTEDDDPDFCKWKHSTVCRSADGSVEDSQSARISSESRRAEACLYCWSRPLVEGKGPVRISLAFSGIPTIHGRSAWILWTELPSAPAAGTFFQLRCRRTEPSPNLRWFGTWAKCRHVSVYHSADSWSPPVSKSST